MATVPHILVIEARFYEELADALYEGASEVLRDAGAKISRLEVPGVLEIPSALSMALAAMENGDADYDGFVVLGVVIRGETTHYDIVCNESARAIMDLTVDAAIAVGNGIQTVENEAQAWARASIEKKNKGGGAAEACLRMIEVRDHFGV